MLDIPATLQEKRNSPLPCRHNTPACGSPVQTRPQRPEAACQDCASPHFYYDQAKTTGPTPGVPSTTWMLPLALRRAITFRPFLVLMRFRNPCSRLRLRFEGCLKVNDIAHSLSRDHSSMKRPHYRGGTGGCQSTCLLQSALQGRTEGEPELEWGKVSDHALATQPRTLEALLPDCDKHATETGRGRVLPHRSN